MYNEPQAFGLEIDFLPVGEESKSGDAICVRWGYNLSDKVKRKQFVMVIDGGYKECGKFIVNHIQKYYKTKKVDLVVSTHPHKDHIGGLEEVLQECEVSKLLIHRPWDHPNLSASFKDGRVTDKSIRNHLKEGLEAAYALVQTAKSRGVLSLNAFKSQLEGDHCGVNLYVLGPTREYYAKLLPAFTATPTDGDGVELGQRVELSDVMVPSDRCPLNDFGSTSAENNASIILALKLPESANNGILLFTGDAGIPALERALNVAGTVNLEIPKHICFFQIPHHGSIQNLGPTILNKILGSEKRSDVVAYVSVAQEHGREHPAKHVINALSNRGIEVFKTAGCSICSSIGICPCREGWEPMEGLPYYDRVEKVFLQGGRGGISCFLNYKSLHY